MLGFVVDGHICLVHVTIFQIATKTKQHIINNRDLAYRYDYKLTYCKVMIIMSFV